MRSGNSALRASAEILLDYHDVEKSDRVALAEALAGHIDKSAALAIGMLSSSEPERGTSVGGTAGKGALLTLLVPRKRREA